MEIASFVNLFHRGAGKNSDDPSEKNEEPTQLWTDQLGTEGKIYSSKSIECY